MENQEDEKISILDRSFEKIRTITPSNKSVAVFTYEAAKTAFNDGKVDFVYLLSNNNRYKICKNLNEVMIELQNFII